MNHTEKMGRELCEMLEAATKRGEVAWSPCLRESARRPIDPSFSMCKESYDAARIGGECVLVNQTEGEWGRIAGGALTFETPASLIQAIEEDIRRDDEAKARAAAERILEALSPTPSDNT